MQYKSNDDGWSEFKHSPHKNFTACADAQSESLVLAPNHQVAPTRYNVTTWLANNTLVIESCHVTLQQVICLYRNPWYIIKRIINDHINHASSNMEPANKTADSCTINVKYMQ